MSEPTMNALEALGREIGRVTELREQYASLDGLPNVNVKPAMAMMAMSLENAKVAVGTNDPILVIRALEDLKGYEG